jgi:hypothetical protein
MSDPPSYIRDQDKDEYRRFCLHHLPSFTRKVPQEIWHYTGADGLIGILRSGQIWSTQVACVNDTGEQRYFGDLVRAGVRKLRAAVTDPRIAVLARVADDALTVRDFSTAGHFVACFSEVEDDLGQWRGHGGGECGHRFPRRRHPGRAEGRQAGRLAAADEL